MNKFLVFNDAAKLGKYLRFLGFDVIISQHLSHANIQRIVNKDRRIIISRKKDKNLKERVIFIKSEIPIQQFAEITNYVEIDNSAIGSRCMKCNRKLDSIDKEKIKYRIPEFVYNQHSKFQFCSKCGNIFWEGSHFNNLKKELLDVKNKS